MSDDVNMNWVGTTVMQYLYSIHAASFIFIKTIF